MSAPIPHGGPATTSSPAPHGGPSTTSGAARRRRRRRGWESHREPLLPVPEFRRRVVYSALTGLGVIGFSLVIGVIGYHLTGPFGWLDSLYNASMILGGMGPVDSRPLAGQPGALKVFASCYALYSGVALLTSVGVMFAPVVHRVLHRFHLADAGDSG